MTPGDSLLDVYRHAWPRLQRVRADHRLSDEQGVHFARVPERWPALPLRVAIVGQETYGWSQQSSPEEQVAHPAIRLLETRRNTPFWQATRLLMERLTGDAATPFLWTNLVPIDGGRRAATSELRDAIRAAVPAAEGTTGDGLLRHVLRAARPDVVLFLTGPSGYYRWEMGQQFPGVAEEPAGGYDVRALLRFKHCALPEATFRTYHPAYLRRGKRFEELLGKVADEVLARVTPRI